MTTSVATPVAGKPRRTGRRIVAVTLSLVGLGVVAVSVVWMFERPPANPAVLTCVGFEKPAEDGFHRVAVMVVSNRSKSKLQMNAAGYFSANWQFVTPSPTGGVVWSHGTGRLDQRSLSVPPKGTGTNRFLLPMDGRTGRMLTLTWEAPRTPPLFIRWLYKAFKVRTSQAATAQWVECEQEIQCPRLGPDRTVEPGKLLPNKKP